MSNEPNANETVVSEDPIGEAIEAALSTKDAAPKKIAPKDLKDINDKKLHVQTCLMQAEKLTADARIAAAEARIAELEYKSLIQHVFIKYNMKMSDRIDDTTGTILPNTEEDKNESE